jgi:hypothetical protein
MRWFMATECMVRMQAAAGAFSVATQFMVAGFMVRMHAAVSAFSVATQCMVITVQK